MEQKFYRDEFEQILRDTTEDFKMYPSRKVWHSIYNDLHPDRKWPSLTVCLLLITAILYIGVSNNNSITKGTKNFLDLSATAGANISPELTNKNNNDNKLQNNSSVVLLSNAASAGNHNNILAKNIKNSNEEVVFNNSLPQSINKPLAENILLNPYEVIGTKKIDNSSIIFTNTLQNPPPTNTDNNNKPTGVNLSSNNKSIKNKETMDVASAEKIFSIAEKENNSLDNFSLSNKTNTVKETKTLNADDKSWLEDFAFHNKRNRNKWKSNVSFQYYVTPSVGYRKLYKNNDVEPTSGLLLRTVDNASEVTQQASINLEAGTAVLIGINKSMRFKTGVQFNYTNYITYSHALQHPTQTTVLMNDLNNNAVMPVFYNSNYGNILGSNFNKLNNKTLQISLPIGLDYKVAGNDKIKWYVGAAIQPTYISSGNAYLISADYKNFAEDPSMLRKWNINSSFETFLSIKTASGVFINAGPQFRYQILSTYGKQYTYTEKLYNVGVKLGITKKL